MARNKEIKSLDPEAVAQIIDEINGKSKEFIADEKMVDEFLKNHPKNDDLITVIQKIRLIDLINSTNLRMYKEGITVTELAQIIVNESRFDSWIQNGDSEAVKLIARNKGSINLFSFASKYCCYHNYCVYGKDAYSIYDTVLKDTLPYYYPISKTDIENMRETFDYDQYRITIDKVIKNNHITCTFKRRKTDLFLWYHNKLSTQSGI